LGIRRGCGQDTGNPVPVGCHHDFSSLFYQPQVIAQLLF
jgi:hypothetical protein